MRPRPWVLGLIVGAACSGGTSSLPTIERVVIPVGASFAQITDTLVAHGVVTHPTWFKLLARVRGIDRSVQAGVYEFPKPSSSGHVLSTLAEGRVVLVRFTVPEGLTAQDVAPGPGLGGRLLRGLSLPRDLHRPRWSAGTSGRAGDGGELAEIVAAAMGSTPRQPGNDPARTRDIGVHRRGGGRTTRGGTAGCGRLSQPPAARDAPPGRPYGPIRHRVRNRTTQEPPAHQRLPVSLTLQHIPSCRAAPRPYLFPGHRKYGSHALPRQGVLPILRCPRRREPCVQPDVP